MSSYFVNTSQSSTNHRRIVSMDGGDWLSSSSSSFCDLFSTLSVFDDGDDSAGEHKTEKNPRIIARKYQLDLCKIALEENTIVYLETGCGKTHIAVLLMYEMRHLIKKPQKKLFVFLAPTVALVQQQAKVIEDSTDFKVGIYCGGSSRLKSHSDWEKEMEKHEVFVMTPQVLSRNLSHCFMRIELIALLIFDECHYAQLDSDHPYAEIMKIFYKNDVAELPRIFGMTASPKLGKDFPLYPTKRGSFSMMKTSSSDVTISGASINTLETLLRAKVHLVEDKMELEQFVNSPKVKIYYYNSDAESSSCPHMIFHRKLEEIKQLVVSKLNQKDDGHESLQCMKKLLQKLHNNLIFCLQNLGLLGLFQACTILLKGDQSARQDLIGAEGNENDDSLCNQYLAAATSYFSPICMEGCIGAELSGEEVLREPLFSRKLLRLIEILSTFRSQPKMKCIIFVNRIVVARCLSHILRTLKFLSSWRSNYLVGVHSGLKSMSRKNMNSILEKFRSGELNLLVATKVGEEGLDIQTCCLVIRFDLPETVSSFIQSRGRARMPESEYIFLVNSGNQKELNLIENFKKDEEKMNEEILSIRPSQSYEDVNEDTYQVTSTGATISSGSSVSLLHNYCSKLPHDEFFKPKPEFFYFDDVEGTICHINLPSNAATHRIVSSPQSSIEAAKKDACLKACKELHELGALTDYLLPDEDDGKMDLEQDFSDSDSCDDEASRQELHEMIVPALLAKPWTGSKDDICLNSYYVKISPHPADRDYRKFALFVKAPLPVEAERMKLDMFLARSRTVMTELVPLGVAKFDKDEILQAQFFQKILFKVILDRSEFVPEFVSLGQTGIGYSGSSTHYLFLPVIQNNFDNAMNVDWNLVRRCLSSPVFRARKDAGHKINFLEDNFLELANGRHDVNDVINSLVYAPCKNTFFFISDIVKEKSGYSEFKDSTNHVQHYAETFGNLLYPDQPLLKAKQLFCLDNLLRKEGGSESREKEEHFIELPPEICQLKIIGFSKDIGSSLSLLPSILHRLESLLVAIELKDKLSASFPEGSEVAAIRILEALTTERCCERYSLERLEVLGDAYLKFAVGRHLFLLHDNLDEGQLTRRRSNLVNNSNLLRLAKMKRLQVYIRDQAFDPSHFYPLGRPCPVICSKEREPALHISQENSLAGSGEVEIRCNKHHHWLHKKTISDVVEALVGVFLVDCGFRAANAFLKWIGIKVDFHPSQVSKICSSSAIFVPLSAYLDTTSLENLLGYQFVHKGLLLQAFVHPSYNKHFGGCYQRLEFLGDAVLDYLITSYLYSVYPKLNPGQLTDLRSLAVNNNSFANIAVGRSFDEFILCDSSCLKTSISKFVNFIKTSASKKDVDEGPSCPKALGDLVESSIGAVLLDSGFDLNRVWKIMLSFMDLVLNFSNLQINPVREIQELCQFYGWDLQFLSFKRNRTYSVEVRVKGESVCEAAGAANFSRKEARKMAAQELCRRLKAQGYKPKAKSLEEIVKSSRKTAAKLIGYDEAAIDITAPDAVPSDSSRLNEISMNHFNRKVHPVSEGSEKIFHPSIGSLKKSQPQLKKLGVPLRSTIANANCNSEPQGAGTSSKKTASSPTGNANSNSETLIAGASRNTTARSRLYEICAGNCWNPPIFDCCLETGPSHLKEFTFKVSLNIMEDSDEIAAFGAPHLRKKNAAEHAAEGTVWYLKNAGYLHDCK